jgi:hypothetical protein
LLKDMGLNMKDIPAFPRPHSGTSQFAQEGMTLRDYFAANVLQGVMSSIEMGITFSKGDKPPSDEIAESCYAMADAMMKAREA